MEYSTALKRKDILTHATTQMNVEVIILGQIKPVLKDENCMISLLKGTRGVKFIETGAGEERAWEILV